MIPIYGFPASLYFDNGSHFVGAETISLFESHGTKVTTAPISHPSSVGLVERNVQLVLAQIRKWVYAKGPQAKLYWGRAVSEILPNINGRLQRIHGFTPAEILVGFNPVWNQHQTLLEPIDPIDLVADQADFAYAVDNRDEYRHQAILALTEHQASLESKQSAAWTQPKPGDLVMVRDIQKDKQHGRKLDPSWLGPRLLTEISA